MGWGIPNNLNHVAKDAVLEPSSPVVKQVINKTVAEVPIKNKTLDTILEPEETETMTGTPQVNPDFEEETTSTEDGLAKMEYREGEIREEAAKEGKLGDGPEEETVIEDNQPDELQEQEEVEPTEDNKSELVPLQKNNTSYEIKKEVVKKEVPHKTWTVQVNERGYAWIGTDFANETVTISS
jgi:hypothetical protein